MDLVTDLSPHKPVAPIKLIPQSDSEGSDCGGSMGIFYVREKVLNDLREKLKDGKEITKEVVDALADEENVDSEEVMVPIDMSAVEEDITDMEALHEKLGGKGVAEMFVNAQNAFQELCKSIPEDQAPKPMTAAEWKKIADEMDAEGE